MQTSLLAMIGLAEGVAKFCKWADDAHRSSCCQSLSGVCIAVQEERDHIEEQRSNPDIGDVDLNIGGGWEGSCDCIDQRLLDVICERCNGQVWD